MAQVSLYTTRFCPFCVRAKMLLDAKNVTYEEVAVDSDAAERRLMASRAGSNTRASDMDWGTTHWGL